MRLTPYAFLAALISMFLALGCATDARFDGLASATQPPPLSATAVPGTIYFNSANASTLSGEPHVKIFEDYVDMAAADLVLNDGNDCAAAVKVGVECGGGAGVGLQLNAALNTGSATMILDAGGLVNWDAMNWAVSMPYGKDLPNNNATESGYPIETSNFDMGGNEMLLHLNENAAPFSDSSGKGNAATCITCPVSILGGHFKGAVNFTTDGQELKVAHSTSTNFSNEFTLSAWVKPTAATLQYIFFKHDTVSNDRLIVYVGATGILCGQVYNGANSLLICDSAGPTLHTGTVPHLITVRLVRTNDDATLELYVDGVFRVSSNSVNFYNANPFEIDGGVLQIGRRTTTQYYGTIDEISLFDRVLTPVEITRMYERGHKLRFQVRPCTNFDCSGGQPPWQGPDGTAITYFSEADNPTNSPLSAYNFIAPIPNSRYLQVQAYFDSPVAGQTPTLRGIEVLPSMGWAGQERVQHTGGLAYNTLTGFDAEQDSGSTGNLAFQLSKDGFTWYYVVAGTWTLVPTGLESSSKGDINTSISSFHANVPPLATKRVYVRAVLHNTDGRSPVKLKSVYFAGN